MASALLAEHRHRYNHRISELRRPCFPSLGMYDTWLIDKLQVLLSTNRGFVLFCEWINTTEFAQTAESFGTVPLHSAALGTAIASIEVREPFKLTREQSYIAKVMGFSLPPLPVHGEKECALFLRLILQHTSHRPDFEQMAVAWCPFVHPSEGIFPKLPVYLRLHHAAYERNVRVRNAVIAAADAMAVLEQLNRATLPAARPAPPPVAAQPAPTAACAAATEAAGALARPAALLPPPASRPSAAAASRPTINYSLAAAARPWASQLQWPGSHSYGTVALLPHAPAAMRASAVPLLVGDRLVGGERHEAGEQQQQRSNEMRAVGQRGQDARPRNARTCKSCKQTKDTCVGAQRGAEFCVHAPRLPRGESAGD
jgi:hypothetical protein